MSTQQTLAGDEADESREKHGTQVYCWECNEWVIRTRRDDHPHPIVEDADEDDEESDPERAGGMYEITLSYTVDYQFRIPAWNEHQATKRAEDLVEYPANCADAWQVHSDDREIFEILDDDPNLPDDFDVYGSEMLWEVWDESGGRE